MDVMMSNDKNPVLSVVDGKICINGRVFDVHELRESKEYLQSIGAEEAFYYPESDEELEQYDDSLSPEEHHWKRDML